MSLLPRFRDRDVEAKDLDQLIDASLVEDISGHDERGIRHALDDVPVARARLSVDRPVLPVFGEDGRLLLGHSFPP